MRTLPILLSTLLASPFLQAQPASPKPGTPMGFKVASKSEDCPVCLDGLQGAVDSIRTRGPKVDMEATVTAFARKHPGAALLVLGADAGHLGLWAYLGTDGTHYSFTKLSSEAPFADCAAFAKGAKTSDPALAALLLPEPVQARILGAKSLVIVPPEGLPKVDFPGLVPTGWTQTLGQKLKVMVVRKIEALNEL